MFRKGAAGAIIIEDTPQDIPAWLLNIPDQVLMLHNWFMSPNDSVGVVNISGVVGDKLVAPSYTPHTSKPGVADLQDDWWTVNGRWKSIYCLFFSPRHNLLENTDGGYSDPISVLSGRRPATFGFC